MDPVDGPQSHTQQQPAQVPVGERRTLASSPLANSNSNVGNKAADEAIRKSGSSNCGVSRSEEGLAKVTASATASAAEDSAPIPGNERCSQPLVQSAKPRKPSTDVPPLLSATEEFPGRTKSAGSKRSSSTNATPSAAPRLLGNSHRGDDGITTNDTPITISTTTAPVSETNKDANRSSGKAGSHGQPQPPAPALPKNQLAARASRFSRMPVFGSRSRSSPGIEDTADAPAASYPNKISRGEKKRSKRGQRSDRLFQNMDAKERERAETDLPADGSYATEGMETGLAPTRVCSFSANIYSPQAAYAGDLPPSVLVEVVAGYSSETQPSGGDGGEHSSRNRLQSNSSVHGNDGDPKRSETMHYATASHPNENESASDAVTLRTVDNAGGNVTGSDARPSPTTMTSSTASALLSTNAAKTPPWRRATVAGPAPHEDSSSEDASASSSSFTVPIALHALEANRSRVGGGGRSSRLSNHNLSLRCDSDTDNSDADSAINERLLVRRSANSFSHRGVDGGASGSDEDAGPAVRTLRGAKAVLRKHVTHSSPQPAPTNSLRSSHGVGAFLKASQTESFYKSRAARRERRDSSVGSNATGWLTSPPRRDRPERSTSRQHSRTASTAHRRSSGSPFTVHLVSVPERDLQPPVPPSSGQGPLLEMLEVSMGSSHADAGRRLSLPNNDSVASKSVVSHNFSHHPTANPEREASSSYRSEHHSANMSSGAASASFLGKNGRAERSIRAVPIFAPTTLISASGQPGGGHTGRLRSEAEETSPKEASSFARQHVFDSPTGSTTTSGSDDQYAAEHEKKVDAVLMRLTRDHKPVGATSSAALNDEVITGAPGSPAGPAAAAANNDAGSGETAVTGSWAGVGSLGWPGLVSIGGDAKSGADEGDTIHNGDGDFAVLGGGGGGNSGEEGGSGGGGGGWMGVGGGAMSSEDWYARMRRKANAEEDDDDTPNVVGTGTTGVAALTPANAADDAVLMSSSPTLKHGKAFAQSQDDDGKAATRGTPPQENLQSPSTTEGKDDEGPVSVEPQPSMHSPAPPPSAKTEVPPTRLAEKTSADTTSEPLSTGAGKALFPLAPPTRLRPPQRATARATNGKASGRRRPSLQDGGDATQRRHADGDRSTPQQPANLHTIIAEKAATPQPRSGRGASEPAGTTATTTAAATPATPRRSRRRSNATYSNNNTSTNNNSNSDSTPASKLIFSPSKPRQAPPATLHKSESGGGEGAASHNTRTAVPPTLAPPAARRCSLPSHCSDKGEQPMHFPSVLSVTTSEVFSNTTPDNHCSPLTPFTATANGVGTVKDASSFSSTAGRVVEAVVGQPKHAAPVPPLTPPHFAGTDPEEQRTDSASPIAAARRRSQAGIPSAAAAAAAAAPNDGTLPPASAMAHPAGQKHFAATDANSVWAARRESLDSVNTIGITTLGNSSSNNGMAGGGVSVSVGRQGLRFTTRRRSSLPRMLPSSASQSTSVLDSSRSANSNGDLAAAHTHLQRHSSTLQTGTTTETITATTTGDATAVPPTSTTPAASARYRASQNQLDSMHIHSQALPPITAVSTPLAQTQRAIPSPAGSPSSNNRRSGTNRAAFLAGRPSGARRVPSVSAPHTVR